MPTVITFITEVSNTKYKINTLTFFVPGNLNAKSISQCALRDE